LDYKFTVANCIEIKMKIHKLIIRLVLIFSFAFQVHGIYAQDFDNRKDTLNIYFGSSFRFLSDNVLTNDYSFNFSCSYLINYEFDLSHTFKVIPEVQPFRLTWSYVNDDSLSDKTYDEIRLFMLSFDFGLNTRFVIDNESNVYHNHWIDLGIYYSLPLTTTLRLKNNKEKNKSHMHNSYNDLYLSFRYFRGMTGYTLEYHPFIDFKDNRLIKPYTIFLGIDIFINAW